jgi:hypothetical protein
VRHECHTAPKANILNVRIRTLRALNLHVDRQRLRYSQRPIPNAVKIETPTNGFAIASPVGPSDHLNTELTKHLARLQESCGARRRR